jgi:hypothetical protein
VGKLESIKQVLAADAEARQVAAEKIARLSRGSAKSISI